jgi:hypothetical protein
MLSVKQYTEFKTKISNWQSKVDRAKGVIDEVTKNLKSEFEVESLEEAKKLYEKLQRQCEAAESQFMDEYNQFIEKWGDVLDG